MAVVNVIHVFLMVFGSLWSFVQLNHVPVPTFIVKRPGNCSQAERWPFTIQCGSGECIDQMKWRDGAVDCEDESDEKRIDPPGSCGSDPDPEIQEWYKKGLTMQCQVTKRCLLLLKQPNGVCECCGDNSNCDECTDHSDEDICSPDKWFRRSRNSPLPEWLSPNHFLRQDQGQWFSCDNKCRPEKLMFDDKQDCFHEPSEPQFAKEFDDPKEKENREEQVDFCRRLRHKGTPHFQCTSTQYEKCVLLSAVLNIEKNCDGGEDEDSSLHGECTGEEMKEHCDSDTTAKCIRINDGQYFDCRCKNPTRLSNGMGCNKKNKEL